MGIAGRRGRPCSRIQDGGITWFKALICRIIQFVECFVIEGSRDVNMCRVIDVFQGRENQIMRKTLAQRASCLCWVTSTSISLISLQPSAQDISGT